MKELFNHWIEFESTANSSTNRFIHECVGMLADELLTKNFNGQAKRFKVTVQLHDIGVSDE